MVDAEKALEPTLSRPGLEARNLMTPLRGRGGPGARGNAPVPVRTARVRHDLTRIFSGHSCLEAGPDTRWDCACLDAGPETRFDSDCEGNEVLGRVVADDACAEVLSSSVRSSCRAVALPLPHCRSVSSDSKADCAWQMSFAVWIPPIICHAVGESLDKHRRPRSTVGKARRAGASASVRLKTPFELDTNS